MNEENAEVNTQTYSQGKGPDSPGSFRFEKTKRINSKIVSGFN